MFDPSIGKERIFARAANHLRPYVAELDDCFRDIEIERRRDAERGTEIAGHMATRLSDRINELRKHLDIVVHGAAEAAAMTLKDGFWHVNPIDREHTLEARERIFSLCRNRLAGATGTGGNADG